MRYNKLNSQLINFKYFELGKTEKEKERKKRKLETKNMLNFIMK